MRISILILLVILACRGSDLLAESQRDTFETKIREQLDYMFSADEYMVNVQLKRIEPSHIAKEALPGVAFFGEDEIAQTSNSNGDLSLFDANILLVVSPQVSKARLGLAEEVLRRVASSEGIPREIQFRTRQQQISKENIPTPKIEPSIKKTNFDLINENMNLIIKIAIGIWAAIISLIAVNALMKKIEHTKEDYLKSENARKNKFSTPESIHFNDSDYTSEKPAQTSKDVRDTVVLKQINDLVEEAVFHSEKIAVILTKWVSLSAENTRYAALFLRNCDIKTVESISTLLHPSDVEKIIKTTIEDFDAFGLENQSVLEKIRGELALLSAEKVLKKNIDTLDFAKNLSAEDIYALVSGETLRTVALVSTQIPPHRLQSYYDSLSPSEHSDLCILISSLQSPSLADFEELKTALLVKAESLGSVLFNDKVRYQTLIQVLKVLSSPSVLMSTASEISIKSPDVYRSIRPYIILPLDINFLPARAVNVLVQSIDAETLAGALSTIESSFDRICQALPEAYRMVFIDRIKDNFDSSQSEACWNIVLNTLNDLAFNRLITKSEFTAASQSCDAAMRSQLISESRINEAA